MKINYEKKSIALLYLIIGSFFSLFISTLLAPEARPISDGLLNNTEMLSWTWPAIKPEPREKIFLMLTIIFGLIGCFIGFDNKRANLKYDFKKTYIFIFFAVLLLNFSCKYVLYKDPYAILISLIALLVVVFCICKLITFSKNVSINNLKQINIDINVSKNFLEIKSTSLFLLIYFFLTYTNSIETLAANIGLEAHIVSFIVGPSLYNFSNGLLPGVHYFSQYGIGWPYLFSFILGSNIKELLMNYVDLMMWSMFIYYSIFGLFLRWFLGSTIWALICSLTIFILHFHTERIFFDPSSYVLRHPLLIVNIALFSWLIKSKKFSSVMLLSVSLATSIYLNTETAIYQIFTFFLLSLMLLQNTKEKIIIVSLSTFITLITFVLISFLSYGSQILQKDFFLSLVEPFFIYSGGFGSHKINWRIGLEIFYYIIFPGISLLTIAWGLIEHKKIAEELQPRITALLSLSILSILFTIKFWNMSINALWFVNSFGFIAVFFWWFAIYFIPLTKNLHKSKKNIFSITCLILLIVFLFIVNDVKNKTYYGLSSYKFYPSLINKIIGIKEAKNKVYLDNVLNNFKSEDVDLLIRMHNLSKEILLLDDYDWAYYAEARIPPKSRFLPSTWIFTKKQFSDAVENLEIIILPVDENNKVKIVNEDFKLFFDREIKKYEQIDKGINFIALKKTMS